jgi:hypothetical protein
MNKCLQQFGGRIQPELRAYGWQLQHQLDHREEYAKIA